MSKEKKYRAMEKKNLPLSLLEEQVRGSVEVPVSQAWKMCRVLSSEVGGSRHKRKLRSAKTPF